MGSQLSLHHRDPGYAKRAKTLIIRRGPIYSRKYKPPRSPLGYRWPIWKSIKAKFSQMRRHVVGHEPETFLDQLLDAVPGLTTLTTLDVSLPYNLEDPFFHTTKLSVIKAGWSVFGASLTTLSFNMPLEEIHLISLSHIRLLRLENFSIVLQIFHPTSQPNELIRKSVLPFLIAHGPTLRSLELVALKKVDMSSILNGLRHMPRLNSLNISHHFRSLKLTSLIGHHQFLKVHQSQLQHLTFETQSFCSDMEITDEFFNQEWCHVLLPELRSLSFSLSGFRVSCEAAAIPYFQRHISTVKSLTILALYFSYDQVASILMGPKQGGYQLTALRTLNIQIWCFSPALLSLLADQAPQLRSLKLYVCVIGPDKQPESFASNRVPEVGRSFSVCPLCIVPQIIIVFA